LLIRSNPYARSKEGTAEDQQEIGEDGTEERGLHHAKKTTLKRKVRDDHLGGVAKGGVEQAAQRVACVQRHLLGDLAEETSQWEQTEAGYKEDHAVRKASLVHPHGNGHHREKEVECVSTHD